MTEKTYFDKMRDKIINEEALKELDKIEDREERLQAISRLLGRPTIECLNDLDARLRKLEDLVE
jgi:hypothetical protein